MKRYSIDPYVLDVLLPDLVGHDRRPAAFLVYLCLMCAAERAGTPSVALSLQDIAVRTGLAKSTVQAAIRHLRRRALISDEIAATTTHPVRRLQKPWVR